MSTRKTQRKGGLIRGGSNKAMCQMRGSKPISLRGLHRLPQSEKAELVGKKYAMYKMRGTQSI